MKKILSWLMVLTMVLGLCACGPKAPTWQEQYDLGVKYLTEGNYEEAIIAFTAAIEIDPKKPEAYLKLADAYEGAGDFDKAQKALEDGLAATGDEGIQGRLEELTALPTGAPGQVKGTLSIRDFSYEYEDGGSVSEWNEGAVGGMGLDFVLTGPDRVRDAWIGTWSENGFTQKEIDEQVAFYIGVWKDELDPNGVTDHRNIGSGQSFPIYPEDCGKTLDVLLVGLDENGDAAGYAIVTVQVP